MGNGPLSHLRICDLTGQLAGAGATRHLAALGAQVIRVEDPTNQGRWDILRGTMIFKDERRGIEFGGGFQNHNVEKLGVTINLRSEKGKAIFRRLVAMSDAVTENFAAGVMERLGFGYEALKAIRPDIVYVSNCGFGQEGPYRNYKTWGPSVQAFSGLTFASGLPDLPPAGWGYSYMDHTGGYFMAMAIMAALHHRNATGEGQWVDCATTEEALTLAGPALLDYTVNGRPLRRPGMPNSNRSQHPAMAPHGVYPADQPDSWVAVACRDDGDWTRMVPLLGEWAEDERFGTLAGRLVDEDELDRRMAEWTRQRDPFATAKLLMDAGVTASAVQTPEQRIDQDANTAAWGLWPQVDHLAMGEVRVDGMPVHFSKTDWRIERAAPLLGQHNDYVLGDLLGIGEDERKALHEEGVI